MDKRGTMLEIESPQLGPTGKLSSFSTSAVHPVEIARITMGENKKPTFFDKDDKAIQNPKPLIRKELSELKELNQSLIVQKFVIDKTPFFLDLAGNVVEVEQGRGRRQYLDGTKWFAGLLPGHGQ